MRAAIGILKGLLSVIYALYKLLPVQNKITFFSRQADAPGVDFQMLAEKLQEENPDYRMVMLCRLMKGKISYLFYMVFVQMYHLATSRVAILDSYCIPVSLLNHRKELKVLQMWHALGAYKKFGKSILDREEGRSSRVAELMQMHRGYDVILTSSAYSRSFFAEAFGYPAETFRTIPLPRTDLLRDPQYLQAVREKICRAYPALTEKKVILYAPTLRKDEDALQGIEDLIRAVDYDRYHLILSAHPLIQKHFLTGQAFVCTEFTSMELLSVCDVFVTDYSAMIYEAALVGKPVYVYAYDLDAFAGKRGFYLNPEQDLPLAPERDPHVVMRRITEEACQPERVTAFADRYIVKNKTCTKSIASLIQDLL